MRDHRAPDDAEIHAEGVLAPVAREVDAARRLVRETAPGRRGRRHRRALSGRRALATARRRALGWAGCRPMPHCRHSPGH